MAEILEWKPGFDWGARSVSAADEEEDYFKGAKKNEEKQVSEDVRVREILVEKAGGAEGMVKDSF